MTTHVTRWSPDTCQCIVEYSWDDSTPAKDRVHTFSRLVKSCEVHKNLNTELDVYNAIKEENPRKNISLNIILNHSDAPSALFDIVNGNRQLKDTIKYKWSWIGSQDRELDVEFITVNTDQKVSIIGQTKNNIQSALNARFGNGKVVLL